MPRPLFDSEFIFGIHEPGGEELMLAAGRPGWVVFTEAVGHDPDDFTGLDFSSFATLGLGVICRINNGYEPEGTIPHSSLYEPFARRVANFVATSRGCKIWVIGNEMNYAVERPGIVIDWSRHQTTRTGPAEIADPLRRGIPVRFNVLPDQSTEIRTTRGAVVNQGEVITPDLYARCYKLCRDAIRLIPGHEDDLVLVGAVCPWNSQTIYPGNANGDWVQYFRDILDQLGPETCDGFALHAFTHGSDPALIASPAKLPPPFQNHHLEFRTFTDYLAAVPPAMRHLPAFITEMDQSGPWADRNEGWVQRAYAEVDTWNKLQVAAGNPQQVHAAALYRWPRMDMWYIDGKEGVMEDFRAALDHDYRWRNPAAVAAAPSAAGASTVSAASPASTASAASAASAAAPSAAPPAPPASRPGKQTGRQQGRQPKQQGKAQGKQGQSAPAKQQGKGAQPAPAATAPAAPPAPSVSPTAPRAIAPAAPAAPAKRQPAKPPPPYQVEWVDDRFPPRMLAGQTITVPITVKNAGSLTWRVGGGNPFRLGYAYYRNRKRLPMPLDRDVRTDITDDVLPGDAAVIEARIALPHDPGNYTLELDLVHEGVTWFKDQGSPVLTRWVTVEVLPPSAAGESSTSAGNGAGGSGLPNLPVPLFVDVTAGLPHTGTPYARRNLSQIRYIVISHTGGNPRITLERIARAHIAAGYPGIAYDFVVDSTGQVFRVGEMENVAQPDEVWSEQGVNIALAGNFSASTPALAQIDATGRLCAWLAQNLGLEPEAIVGLGELSQSDNPGPLFYRGPTWKQMIVRQVQLHLAALGMGAVDAVRLQQALAEAQNVGEANRTLIEQLGTATTELESLQVANRQLQDVVTDLQKQLDFQAQTGARQPPIRNVVAQLPRDRLRYRQRKPEEIRYVVINHTGAAPETPLAALAEVHRREWPGLLYDFVIDAQAGILQAQPLEEVVATNEPYLRNAVTVAFAGDFNSAVPSREQIDAGGRLIAWLMERFPQLTPDSVWGLSELTRSPSPGRQWSDGAKWKQHLLAAVRRSSGLIESSALEAQLRARVTELEGQLGQAQRTAAALQEVRLRLEAETRRLEGEIATKTVAQTAYVVPKPPMRNIAEQLPRHPTLRYERRALAAISHVAVHHTAAPPTLGPLRIAELHIQADPARGKDPWPGIGYHFFIHADGAIEQTNPLEQVCFHVYRHNHYTVGVVFAGSFMNGKIPTSAQLRSGAHLIAWLMQEHDIPLARVWGHREFPENVTVCPGSEWQQGNRWRDLLFERVQQVTEGSGVKSIRHYLLFWQRPYPGPMARLELAGALPYIARFRPTVGFSLEDARNAEFVTIAGSEAGINAQVERALEEFGCRVERIAGRDDEETGRILADMAEKGKRFVKFDVDF